MRRVRGLQVATRRLAVARRVRPLCPRKHRNNVMDDDFRKAALDYHRYPRPGKLAIEATKRMTTQRDLALAYSPGVAAACEAIQADPDAARDLYRARQPRRRHHQRHRRAG